MSAKRPVLYVDDEEQNLVVFAAAFEDDYEIHTAASARAAIQILRRHPIDVVITDQRMPQMTGVQLLEAIGPEYPDAVRMILTGFTDIEAIIQAINTGRVDRYITKPWDAQALGLTIERSLESQALRRKNRELVGELEARVARAREIREMFQKYVPEPVVRAMLEGGRGASGLHGESRIVTIMFVRIPRFTALAERVAPKACVQLVNRYFAAMTRIILEHRGMVSEFFAEGILAVFGAPVSSLTNEQNAVDAALAMVAAMVPFNAEHAVPVLGRALTIGIGLHRGEVLAGNIGSRERMKYGVIGDPVNVAARIQAKTREDGNDILMSRALLGWLERDHDVESLGEVSLRGKSEPLEIVRVKGVKAS